MALNDGGPQTNFAHGKNPRRLHLPSTDGGRMEFDIQERVTVERALLSAVSPANTLDGPEVRQLASWLAKRYVRAAYPDAFNDRVRSAQRKIDKALKSYGEGASGVFLALNSWEELSDDDEYEVVVIVTCPLDVANDAKKEAVVAQLAPKIMEALEGCEGVSVLDARHVSEDEFTLHDLRTYKRWDFDHRSFSGRPGGPTVPESEG